MANRRLEQFHYSYEKAPVRVFAQVAIGAAGAPTLTRGLGVSSVSRTSEGLYRVVLTDKFNRLLSASAILQASSARGYVCEVAGADVDAASPYVDFRVVSTLGDPTATSIGLVEVQTVTFDTKANSTAGDHVVIYDTTGTAWGISLDVTGSDAEPTASTWTSIAAANKVHVDISGATTAAQVAAAVEAAFDALTGVTDVLTTDDSAADGTMTFTSVSRGAVNDPVVSDDDGAGDGSIEATVTTEAIAVVPVDPTSGDTLWIELALKNSTV